MRKKKEKKSGGKPKEKLLKPLETLKTKKNKNTKQGLFKIEKTGHPGTHTLTKGIITFPTTPQCTSRLQI